MMADRDFIAGGYLVRNGGLEPCTVIREGGSYTIDEGLPDRCDFNAIFIRDLVNAHTHCADYGLDVPQGMSLEELVAPPDGLKHRYLSGLDRGGLSRNMVDFSKASAASGTAAFVDFREGGAEGCGILRESSEDAIILGRPVSKEYDSEEVAEILSVADGIGLSSISDMPLEYIEAVADDVRSAKKIFAIHASERIREDIDEILSLDPAFVVHMCEATDDDFAKCAEAEVPIVVCPSSNMYFGKVSPIKRMLDNGADLAIGTDNGMLCEPDMVAEASKFMQMLEKQGGDPDAVWGALSDFSTKLLYRAIGLKRSYHGLNLTVIPIAKDPSEIRSLDGNGCFRI